MVAQNLRFARMNNDELHDLSFNVCNEIEDREAQRRMVALELVARGYG